MGRALAAVVALAALAIGACGSSARETSHASSDELSCLTRLGSHCCTLQKRRGDKCVADFGLAQRCTSWPAGTTLVVYAEPCGGLRAVRLIGASYSTFFVYDDADQLIAVADNAASEPGSTDIGCGAGPAGFFLPADCSPGWLDRSKGQACDATIGELPTQPWCADAGP
jgi:hypothetical protein